MEIKIKLEAINAYSIKVSDKILASFPDEKESFSGKELLNLTEVRQLNLFTIHEVFGSWRNTIEEMKGGFFDFEKPEVQEAFNHFANVLSHNILVQRGDISRIITSAIENTLLYFFFPGFFLDQRFGRLENPATSLSEQSKYLSLFREDIAELQETLSKGQSFKNALSQCQFSNPGEEVDTKLSGILELSYHDLIEDDSSEAEPIESNENKVHEKFSKPETLHEKLGAGEKIQAKNLSDKFSRSDISQMPLNERILFQNGLFNGDKDKFSEFLGRMGTCGSLEEASRVFLDEYARPSSWDLADDKVIQLQQRVEMVFKS